MSDCTGATLDKQADPKRVANYGASIRAATYGLWSGRIDLFDFVEMMSAAFSRELRFAWYAGAEQCGIRPEDLTQEETLSLEEMVNQEIMFVMNFANSIMEGSRENGGKFAPLVDRTSLWVNRYQDAFNRGMMMACRDEKLVWRLGFTERHCSTCKTLDGTVLRASQWQRSGYRPQNPPNDLLECGGWKCGCYFERTDMPVTASPPLGIMKEVVFQHVHV